MYDVLFALGEINIPLLHSTVFEMFILRQVLTEECGVSFRWNCYPWSHC